MEPFPNGEEEVHATPARREKGAILGRHVYNSSLSSNEIPCCTMRRSLQRCHNVGTQQTIHGQRETSPRAMHDHRMVSLGRATDPVLGRHKRPATLSPSTIPVAHVHYCQQHDDLPQAQHSCRIFSISLQLQTCTCLHSPRQPHSRPACKSESSGEGFVHPTLVRVVHHRQKSSHLGCLVQSWGGGGDELAKHADGRVRSRIVSSTWRMYSTRPTAFTGLAASFI